MPDAPLHAPWRIDYIRTLDKPVASDKTSGGAGAGGSSSCFLCAAAAAQTDQERRERLVLWTTPHSVVLINRYPYTNGHLLIAPIAHVAELDEVPDEVGLDLHRQTTKAIQLLRRAISPQGFNVGINLGRCAGAGVPGHIHQHVVPRWAGDTNFMSVIGEVRVVPQAMSQLYEELVKQGQGARGERQGKTD